MLHSDPGATRDAGRRTYDVVIPCYNRADTVEQALDSVLTQAEPPQRVILVDDGSSDRTARVLRELERCHGRVQAVLLPRNGGASAARNAGMACARAEWLAFLDSDDAWLPGAAVALLDAAGDHDVVVGQFRRAWPDGTLGDPECGWEAGDILPALARTGAIGPSWSIVRRTAAASVGGFDPSFHNCNDWDFYVRLLAVDARFVRVEETVALYHIAQANRLSHDSVNGAANARRVLAHPLIARWLEREPALDEAC